MSVLNGRGLPSFNATAIKTSADGAGSRPLVRKPDAGAAGCKASREDLERLTIATAITRAACDNPRLTDAMLNVQVELAQHGTALSQFLPTAVASSHRAKNYTRGNSFFGLSTETTMGTSHSIAISWLMLDFGGRLAQTRAAERTAFAAMASESALLQETIATVTEAYLNILMLQEMLRAAEAAAAAAQDAVSVAKAKLKGGLGTPVDVEFAQLGAQQQQVTIRNIQGQIRIATGELAITMNLSPDTPLRLERPEDGQSPGDVDGRITERIADIMRGLETHPEIRAAQARAAAAEQLVHVARSELFPKVSAVGNYYFDGRPGQSVAASGSRERFVGLSVSVPLTSPLSEYHRIKQARAQHERSLVQVEDTRRRLQGGFWRAFQMMETAGPVSRTAKLAEGHASRAAAQARIRYENGANDISEWLRAQKAWAESRAELIRARNDLRVARVRVLQALGRLGPWRFGKAPVAAAAGVDLTPTSAIAAAQSPPPGNSQSPPPAVAATSSARPLPRAASPYIAHRLWANLSAALGSDGRQTSDRAEAAMTSEPASPAPHENTFPD